MQTALITLTLALLTSCATPTFQGAGSKEYKRDLFECKRSTSLMTGHVEGSVGNTRTYNRYLTECMESKGYEVDGD